MIEECGGVGGGGRWWWSGRRRRRDVGGRRVESRACVGGLARASEWQLRVGKWSVGVSQRVPSRRRGVGGGGGVG